ncbi:MAG: hypothetical protein V4671_23175 [Armatimonadota bacterium]
MNRRLMLAAGCTKGSLETHRMVESLNEKEADRVFNFVAEALERQKQPARDARYTAIETFTIVARQIQEHHSRADIVFNWEFTESQMDRMEKALALINSVAEELQPLESIALRVAAGASAAVPPNMPDLAPVRLAAELCPVS